MLIVIVELFLLKKDFMSQLEKYRENLAAKITAIWTWLQEMVLFVIAPSHRVTWTDIWNQLLLRLCVVKSRITVDSKEKKRLLDWVATKIHKGKPPTDFNESWKNGITLCALVEGIVKGSCPRYDLLNPEHEVSNLKLALRLIEKNVRIKPGITVEEFNHYDAVTERKLVCLLSQLKLASAKLRLKSAIQRPVISLNAVTTISAEGECIAKGMGLMLAVKGRKARFHIYLKSLNVMNIVVEIKGPENTICSERITNRSPRRRSHTSLEENEEWRKIPLEYNIQPGKITFGYTPLVIGSHQLSIIWQGQHVIGSPYTISVDDAARTVAAEPKEIKRLFVPLKRADSLKDFAKKDNMRCRKRSTVPFGDVRKLGNVTRKRILRHYLIIDGKEVVIENNDIETLAKAVSNFRVKNNSDNSNFNVSELNNSNNLSMDYDKSVGSNMTHTDDQVKNLESNSHSGTVAETLGSLESDDRKSPYNSNKYAISKIHVLDKEPMYNVPNMAANDEHLQQTNHYSKQNDLCQSSLNLYSKPTEEDKENSTKTHISLSSSKLESLSLCDTLYNIKEIPSDSSSDFVQQSNEHSNEWTMIQDSECNKSDNAESTHFQLDYVHFQIPTTSTLDMHIKSSPEMLVEKAFESRVDNTNHAEEESPDYVDSLSSNNASIQNLDVFNQNTAKSQDNKEQSKRSSEHLERCDNNQSVQSSPTVPPSDSSIQQSGEGQTIVQKMAGETSTSEKICSENSEQICIPKSDVLKFHLRNDMTECRSQEKLSPEYNMKHIEENKAEFKQLNNGINDVEHKLGISENNEKKNDAVEENLLQGNSIKKFAKEEEKEITSENYAQRFQTGVTIKLSDDERVLSRISNKETIGSEQEIQSKHNVDEISCNEEQEGNSIGESVFRARHDNDIRQYTDESFNGTKQPNNEANDWISHRREGFLLGLIDENFKILEPLNTEKPEPSEMHYHVFNDAAINNKAAITVNDECITRKLSDSGKSDVSKDFSRFIPLECQRDHNSSVDATESKKSTLSMDEQVKPPVDTLGPNQSNLNLFHSEMKTAIDILRYSQEPRMCMIGFDESNGSSSSSTESKLTNLSCSESSQDIIEPSNHLDIINQNRPLAEKTPEKAIHSRNVPVFNYKQNTVGVRYPFEKQGNNSDDDKVKSESLTMLQNSGLAENIHIQHQTTKKLNILKPSEEESFKYPQGKLYYSPQLPKCLSSNSSYSDTSGSPSLVIQNSDSNTKQHNSEDLDDAMCNTDDDEEEFPFSAIVQEKKEYWEKKLEENAPKQIQKVCCVRKDCNNVDKLKTFWQCVAKDSKNSERTKVHTHRSTSN